MAGFLIKINDQTSKLLCDEEQWHNKKYHKRQTETTTNRLPHGLLVMP